VKILDNVENIDENERRNLENNFLKDLQGLRELVSSHEDKTYIYDKFISGLKFF
jgi:hypothetical protein